MKRKKFGGRLIKICCNVGDILFTVDYKEGDFSMNNSLDEIKENCKNTVSNYALLGAANGINPVPSIDVGIDAGICLKMMSEIRANFGLDNATEEKLKRYELFLPLVKKVFDYATKEGVTILLKSMGKKYLGKSAAKYVPIIGQGIAAAVGYGMMRYFGNAYIDDCYNLAQNIKSFNNQNSHSFNNFQEDTEDIYW